MSAEESLDDGSQGGVREWILVEGDRLVLATGVALVVLVGLLVLESRGLISFANPTAMAPIAGGLIAGSLSLVTLVVSINQLILSREFRSTGEVRETLDDVVAYRAAVAESAGVPTAPATPAALLELLVVDVRERTATLRELTAEHDDPIREEIDTCASQLGVAGDRLIDRLERTGEGMFPAVSAAMRYDVAGQLLAARRIRNRHAVQLDAATRAELDELIEAIERIEVAREHFKTTFLQRELTQFSQLTVTYGLPGVLAAILLGLVHADVGGATVPMGYVPFVSSVLVAVVVLPLTLLGAYILRTATVAHRTASVGAMRPEER